VTVTLWGCLHCGQRIHTGFKSALFPPVCGCVYPPGVTMIPVEDMVECDGYWLRIIWEIA